MADHFLIKTKVFRDDCVPLGDALVVERFSELIAALSHRVGPDVASIFAEPFISKAAEDGQLTIAWYTDLAGRGERLIDLPSEDAVRAEARLTSLTKPLINLIDDSEIGPLVQSAMSLGSKGDVWIIEDRPVLVNWGMKAGAGQAESPLAGLISVPAPIPRPSNLPKTPEPSIAAPVKEAVPTTLNSIPVGVPRIAWAPLVILLGLAALILVWLLLPSSRIFFPYSSVEVPLRDQTKLDPTRAAEATFQVLLERKRLLSEALIGAQCRPDGVLELPGGKSLDGVVLPPVGEAPSSADDQALVDPILPLSPNRLSVGDPSNTQTLLQRLEGGTVLVLAASGDVLSTGTGFSIGNGLIVSNAHVVAPAQNGGDLFIVHSSFPNPLPARIIKVSEPFEDSGTDLSLLEISNKSLPALPLMSNSQSLKLTPVIAAGFPADVMQSDSEYASLLSGVASAVPDLSVSDGIVTSEQELPEKGTQLIFHTAPLSMGNSGGPLVDYCGAVIGVNTFVRRAELRSLNIALTASDLVSFLADTPAAAIPVTDQSCQPAILSPTVPRAADVAPAAEDSDAQNTKPDAPAQETQGGE